MHHCCLALDFASGGVRWTLRHRCDARRGESLTPGLCGWRDGHHSLSAGDNRVFGIVSSTEPHRPGGLLAQAWPTWISPAVALPAYIKNRPPAVRAALRRLGASDRAHSGASTARPVNYIKPRNRAAHGPHWLCRLMDRTVVYSIYLSVRYSLATELQRLLPRPQPPWRQAPRECRATSTSSRRSSRVSTFEGVSRNTLWSTVQQ